MTRLYITYGMDPVADTLLPTVRIRPIVVLGQYEGLKVDGEEGKMGMVRALSRVGITPITRGAPIASDIISSGLRVKPSQFPLTERSSQTPVQTGWTSP
jgi:hypothetical protein